MPWCFLCCKPKQAVEQTAELSSPYRIVIITNRIDQGIFAGLITKQDRSHCINERPPSLVTYISHRTTTSEMIKEGCHPSSWCHSMETLSISLALCNGNSLAFDGPLAVMSTLCLFVGVCLNNLLNKQSRDQWNDTSLRPCGGIFYDAAMIFKRFVMGIHRSVLDYHRKEPIR